MVRDSAFCRISLTLAFSTIASQPVSSPVAATPEPIRKSAAGEIEFHFDISLFLSELQQRNSR